jgi:signal transduction histidine kinase
VAGIRVRTTVAATAVVLLVLAATAVALLLAQRSVLTDIVDEGLHRRMAVVADAVLADPAADRLPGEGDDDSFARVLGADGRVVATTPGFPREITLPALSGAGQRFATLSSPGSAVDFRVGSERVGALTVHVGTPLDDVDDAVRNLGRGLLLAVPTASLLLALAVWVLVGRVLRPVERIRRQVNEISGASLDRRVPEPSSSDEIARLARTMNAMLDRVEEAAARQDRFVADASHELRTPLARARAELEVDAAHPESADTDATRTSVLAELRGMQDLIDELLTLARPDSPRRSEPIDLDDVVLDEVRRFGAAGIPVRSAGVSAAQVEGDRDQLSRVVRNLLENAARHGRSRVDVSLGEDGGAAVLAVADDGDGISPWLRERVFERFARADESRAQQTGGSGLGLAIAREIVEAHGGSIRVDGAHSPGARLVVRLPLAGVRDDGG